MNLKKCTCKKYSKLVQFFEKRHSVTYTVVKTATHKALFFSHIPHNGHITSSTKIWSFKWHGQSLVQVCGYGKHCGQRVSNAVFFVSSYILVLRLDSSACWCLSDHITRVSLSNICFLFWYILSTYNVGWEKPSQMRWDLNALKDRTKQMYVSERLLARRPKGVERNIFC